ncbi:hypothetical protein V6N12_041951 [Hibiscus sabdariffa]|uniref:Uncharacterized protein n=1 Tax=Hibiscus sabdariffa TaxID=183260 RepID=A0ABR2EDC5_9ROSI
MGRRQIGRSVDQITLSLRHVYRQSSIAPFLSDAASASIPTASPSILPAVFKAGKTIYYLQILKEENLILCAHDMIRQVCTEQPKLQPLRFGGLATTIGKFAVTGLLGSTTLEDYMMNLTRNATLLALVALQKDESGESYSFDQWQQ